MKKIIIILLSVLFISCGDSQPSDIIEAEKTEKGSWIFDSSLKKNVQKEEVYYLISPTLRQSFYFAQKRGDRKVSVALSIMCIVAAVSIFVLAILNRGPEFIHNSTIFSIIQFLLLVSALSFYLNKPLGIRWNNDKWIKKEVYDKAMESGSTKPIWDSLENNYLIIEGAFKK
jgi:hypothetical protein